MTCAYSDRPLPIGEGQTISQPYIVAYMSTAAQIEAGDRVLEIGTGSGYKACVLAEMGADVYSVEYIPDREKRGENFSFPRPQNDSIFGQISENLNQNGYKKEKAEIDMQVAPLCFG